MHSNNFSLSSLNYLFYIYLLYMSDFKMVLLVSFDFKKSYLEWHSNNKSMPIFYVSIIIWILTMLDFCWNTLLGTTWKFKNLIIAWRVAITMQLNCLLKGEIGLPNTLMLGLVIIENICLCKMWWINIQNNDYQVTIGT